MKLLSALPQRPPQEGPLETPKSAFLVLVGLWGASGVSGPLLVAFSGFLLLHLWSWGLSGVLGADLMLAPKLHLIIETRLDGFYRTEKTVQSDSFGGDFEQSDWGWEAQLNAPLSLYVALGL